ncbi:hypothetical protein H257_06670 [Aphanomyces astaci]|uniref:PH domain-containing protein n=1 Tax=Aphanomyces astaci TaxID=112090 RepID=W4GMW4_APHAT|nr:hypothetical protein H257_06670 [Aphanomyces astaci]ETV80364.1 hypothetical protein H257_06670 [Aphanomyces astaci]|eukprot:XP_009830288.1 hypothetical protein H257_06670 [Aphanomyces astaci]
MAPLASSPIASYIERTPLRYSTNSDDSFCDAQSNNFNSVEALMKGMLFKRGQGGLFHRKTWKLRHVVLTSSTLRYYELDVRKGELDLRDCSPKSIQVLPRDATYTGTNGTLWRFAVQTPKRRMLFSAASEMEMNVWVRHLHLALAIQRSDFTTIQRLATLQSRNSARVPSSPRPRNSGIGGTPPTLSPRGALPDGSHAVVLRAYRKRTNEMEAFVQAVVSKSCELSDM